MFEINRILKVPPLPEVRNDLRARVRSFVSARTVLPPSSLDKLEDFARQILKETALDKEFQDFVMVLLGNEIWRDTIIATPYNRRLLLLPQCLRNDHLCQGVFDELGLICSGCRNCGIDAILEKAEKLGYTTLVAEGTTVAIGLVEEGAIDAVIGVSCMSVLQRSFEPVTHAALPGIGIPLLGDGCTNTSADYPWLFEEMENFGGISSLTPLSVSLLKNKVSDYFQPPVLHSFFSSGNHTERLALKVMSMGGQRIRPLLAVLAYNAYCVNPQEQIQKTLALVIECFHKASLIHDDIEDGDEFRYGQPVLHQSDGIPAAVNAGDYLIGKGYNLLARLPLDTVVLAECFSIVSSSHVKLSQGQGEDLLLNTQITGKSIDDLLDIFRLKTGEAVKVALLIGAVAGEASQSEKDVLSRFSELFGTAYQIKDDLLEFREQDQSAAFSGYPFILTLLKQEMHENLSGFLQMAEAKDEGLFRRYCSIYEVEKKAEGYLQQYTDKCYQELDKLKNHKLRLGLYGVMGKVYKSNHRV